MAVGLVGGHRANLGNCNWAVATMLYILLSQS